ncbi:MAG: type II toxin-antitoxin system HicA family toxin [Verrucomicrobiota bacterium]|nr:type II toxin-antitoxin system HicA family toxin [Verrucomicrobiota bacterium]
MSKAEKLVAKLLSGRSDKNFSFDDLCHIVERAGFKLRSGKGSHRIYYRDGIAEIINIQPRGRGEAKPYQVKQVRELLVKYKIEVI